MRLAKVAMTFLICAGMATPVVYAKEGAPFGWQMGGRVKDYTCGVDRSITRDGKPSAYLESSVEQFKGFGAITQKISADDYLGKRMKLAGWIKTKDVKDTAGFFMRVDGYNGKIFAFDNMENRLIKGTTDWKEFKIVLDVPRGAKAVRIGFLLFGPGKAWANSLKFVEASKGEASTDIWNKQKFARKPVNLDFTQTKKKD